MAVPILIFRKVHLRQFFVTFSLISQFGLPSVHGTFTECLMIQAAKYHCYLQQSFLQISKSCKCAHER